MFKALSSAIVVPRSGETSSLEHTNYNAAAGSWEGRSLDLVVSNHMGLFAHMTSCFPFMWQLDAKHCSGPAAAAATWRLNPPAVVEVDSCSWSHHQFHNVSERGHLKVFLSSAKIFLGAKPMKLGSHLIKQE